ncbi:DNA-binding response regulator [Vagococcus penaei]|uniref:DNA-binding response regulator n=1 Tax=Vagococcus penaei TaxID=633807 RepID=A0A1Q2D8G0_9ENTE|nr:LytTR family transcriptional regulator DNA-binding domain-containing protein [Vagococcus penaei]AQP54620.1 DNA-binding response regulator [Vagococcus penaei]RSU06667.1 DNA-binding response regulator [Vagococcus penaei]
MHVLIVDDEPLAREELHYLVSQHPKIQTIAEADSVAEAMNAMMDQKPDILFLDIHLTDESGFDLAEKLVKLKQPPYLIFATAYDDYALKAFQVNANDYVLKPFDEKRIHAVLDKAVATNQQTSHTINQLSTSPTLEALPIQGDDRIYLIHPTDIYLVSVDDRELSVHTKNDVYQTTGTLSGIEKKLPPDFFLKTHRSYILNTSKVQEIQPWFNNTLQVTLDNELKVPVSRSYVKQLKERFGLN